MVQEPCARLSFQNCKGVNAVFTVELWRNIGGSGWEKQTKQKPVVNGKVLMVCATEFQRFVVLVRSFSCVLIVWRKSQTRIWDSKGWVVRRQLTLSNRGTRLQKRFIGLSEGGLGRGGKRGKEKKGTALLAVTDAFTSWFAYRHCEKQSVD